MGSASTESAQLALSNGDFATAIPLFREAAGKGDTKAQVLLAQLLLNGKAGVQDPVEAVAWYKKAAVRNPQGDQYVAIAQYNLGALYWSGRGVAKDTDEALRQYNEAATNGFGESQGVLVGMYASGIGVPADIIQALKWALVLAANGDTKGASAVEILRKRATVDQFAQANAAAQKQFPGLKFAGIAPSGAAQLVPERGVPREVVSPAAGYTPAFAALHQRPVSDNAAVIRQIKSHLKALPPPYLFELARRTFPDDNQEGVNWFWLARMRAGYDGSRCTDPTAGGGIQQWNLIADNVVDFIKNHPESSRLGKISALSRDAALPIDISPDWICGSGIQALSAAHGKNPDNLLKPASQWPAIRQAIRDGFEQAVKR
jgi:hypothetical protein